MKKFLLQAYLLCASFTYMYAAEATSLTYKIDTSCDSSAISGVYKSSSFPITVYLRAKNSKLTKDQYKYLWFLAHHLPYSDEDAQHAFEAQWHIKQFQFPHDKRILFKGKKKLSYVIFMGMAMEHELYADLLVNIRKENEARKHSVLPRFPERVPPTEYISHITGGLKRNTLPVSLETCMVVASLVCSHTQYEEMIKRFTEAYKIKPELTECIKTNARAFHTVAAPLKVASGSGAASVPLR